jgi:hypothetical protein
MPRRPRYYPRRVRNLEHKHTSSLLILLNRDDLTKPVMSSLASKSAGGVKPRVNKGKNGKRKAPGQRHPELFPPRSGQGEGHQQQPSQLSHTASNDNKTAFNATMLAGNQQVLCVASGPKNPVQHIQNEVSGFSLPYSNKERLGQELSATPQEIEPTVEMEQPERQGLCLGEDPHPASNAPTNPNHTPVDDPADSSRNAEVDMTPQISSGLSFLNMKDSGGSKENVDPPQGPRGAHPRPQQYVETAPTENMVEVDHEATDVDLRDLSRLSHATTVSNNTLEPALHQVSDRGKPHRVAKPRKKSRAAQNSQTFASTMDSHAPASHSALNVNRAMESFRVALLTDQLRVKYDHDLDIEKWNEATNALNTKIQTHEATIEDLKSQQKEWMFTAGRFTEKAVNNQKFAKGIQADYEKLRKEAAAFHTQSEQVLRKEVAEMEKERTDLCREFEKTTTSMERSQRAMLSAMDEMHDKLSSTEARRNNLFAELAIMSRKYEQKKERCGELEKQISVSEEKARSQPDERHDPVIERLDRLHSQHDKANTQRSQELLKINQSLAEMRETLLTPATAEDLGTVNNSLNQLTER